MSITKKLLFISFLLPALISCRREIKEYPMGCRCEKFAGHYEMYDSISNENYEMVIACHCMDGGHEDTLEIRNFANEYDVRFAISKNGIYVPSMDTTDEHFIAGGFFFGIEDRNGLRTALSVGSGWYGFDSPVNRLVGDSLYIVYKANNVAFYAEDGVPWESISTIQHGKKNH